MTGLDTATHQMKPGDTLPPPGPNYWVAGPCSQYYAQKIATSEPTAYGKQQPWNVCGYTPSQVRGAYGVSTSGMTGKGQTVAIVDAYASPTMRADANQFAKVDRGQAVPPRPVPAVPAGHASPIPLPTSATRPAGTASRRSTWSRCTVRRPTRTSASSRRASCNDPDLLERAGVHRGQPPGQHRRATRGVSLPDDATMTTVFDQMFQVGAAEGIGFFFSSGDSGYESPGEDPASDKLQVDYPTSSPWVTSVGGTSLAIGKARNYQFETSWGTMHDPLAAERHVLAVHAARRVPGRTTTAPAAAA